MSRCNSSIGTHPRCRGPFLFVVVLFSRGINLNKTTPGWLAQRGSVRFDRQRSHSSSSSRPWIDDTVLLESEENYSRSNVRRRIPTSQAAEQSSRTVASRSRSRPTKAQPTSTRSQELDSSEEDFEQRLTTKEQFAPSLRSEVVYQNDFARRSDKGSEETVQQRRKSRLRGDSGGTTSTSTVASVRGGRKLGGRGSSSSRFSNEVEEVVPSSSTRSVESRTRGKIKAISKERNEDVSSDENYPEEFKKLLKAKFKENKLKTVNKLESSTENDFGKSGEKDVPRFKVKVLSTTTEGTTTTVKVITPRPARKFASASSGESNATSKPAPSRSRTSSSEESSENSRSRSRASSPTVATPRSSKKLVTPRSRTSSTTTTTTTEESFATEIASTTPRSTRAYSRRPSIVSQLTSTTTTSTTTRKPYSPTTRSTAPGKRTFSAPSTASASLANSAETESKRDNSFVISSLRNPSAFRSASAQRQSRKPISSNAEINNEVKPVVIPSRSKALSSLNTLKRSQSASGSRVPNRFESNLKKTPVYTPTIPSFRATPPSTSTVSQLPFNSVYPYFPYDPP
ncbi:AAEL005144-PA [Aedes aegypti]|uniref:AAEL005144-PA n=1 Tax=Aedes aegypti TaxID=7159 RepID=Q17AY1_AEDAE|nr:AAEL005144-PA [Aedes aegypti]